MARDGVPVLHGVDLDVPRGSVVAVRGPNGAGKTTLLRALAGLERPDAGVVKLAERDVTSTPPEDRWPRLVLVPQDPGRHLLCERVDEELAFSLRAARVSPAGQRRHVDEALAALDLTRHRHRHPHDLSVGERERVALAVAVAADPDLLLLDEPTRGMDGARRAALAALLRRRADRGRSTLIVTHDARLADAAADVTVHLEAGLVRHAPRPAPVG